MIENPQSRAAMIVGSMCALVLIIGVGGAAAAGGSGGRTNHSRGVGQASQGGEQIVAVAGSSRFLVYIEYAVVNGRLPKTVLLFERTVDGTTRQLATVPRNNSYSLAGRYLSDPTGDGDGGPVQIWNLNTGHEHDRTLPADGNWVAAAPHGYLVVTHKPGRVGVQALETVSLSGFVQSLGSPYPPGKTYGVRVNGQRYVAFRDGGVARPWGAKTATFTHPADITTLIGNNGKTSTPTTYCGVPDTHLIACDTESHRYQLQLYNLDGKLVAHTPDYDADYEPAPAIYAGSAFWTTQAPNQQLRELSSNGAVSTSKRRYAEDGPVTAFHKIVLGAPGKTALLAVTSATSKPTVLVRASTSQ